MIFSDMFRPGFVLEIFFDLTCRWLDQHIFCESLEGGAVNLGKQ